LRLLLPLPLGWLRLQFALAASPSGFTGREPLGKDIVGQWTTTGWRKTNSRVFLAAIKSPAQT
jgi:hypothetical protein